MLRDFHNPGRSPVIAENGMIATSHPVSSAVGLQVLREGGNAIDAAVAALAVQGVVEPQSTGIGGDCFALLSRHGNQPIRGLNGSGRSASGATLDAALSSLEQSDAQVPRQSPFAVTVPGAVDAWIKLLDAHGTWGIDRVLQPAIQYAEEGFAVHPRVRFDWLAQLDLLNASEASKAMLTDNGQAPSVGQRWAFPEMAKTLREVAKKGRAGFYDGWVLEEMLNTLNAIGGVHTAEDFAATAADWVDPISTNFRGYTLSEIPPNGQGLVALMMLKILEEMPVGSSPVCPTRLHNQIEAAHLCYADRNSYIAEGIDDQVADLLSAQRAQMGRDMIHPDTTMAPLAAPRPIKGGDTVIISCVDKDRNSISLINSVYTSFGSGIVAPKAGVWFHNRGQSFRLDPSHPNVLAPNKRPMHTIIPAMLSKGDQIQAAFGVMGADYQPQGQVQLITAMLDHGLDIQAAIDLPRVYANASDGIVDIDPSMPQDVMTSLARKGHKLQITQTPHGGAQGIWIDHENGFLWGGSDPRKDGCAMGY